MPASSSAAFAARHFEQPGLNQISTPARYPLSSTTVKLRLPLLDECRCCFTMVFGRPRMRVMGHLDVRALLERSQHRSVEVLLHVTQRNTRSVCELACQRHDLVVQRVRREHAVDDAEIERFLGGQSLGEEVE